MNYVKPATDDPFTELSYDKQLPSVANQYFWEIARRINETDQSSQLPREELGKVVGNLIKVEGTELVRDQVPSLDKAFFGEVKYEVTPRLGLSAWFLRSHGNDRYRTVRAAGATNEEYEFTELANVFGIGGQYKIGPKARLSFDYGQNRTDFGRFMNGKTKYAHEFGTARFDILGHENGGTPHFWMKPLRD